MRVLTANIKVLIISDNPSVIHLFLILKPRFGIVNDFIIAHVTATGSEKYEKKILKETSAPA